MRISSAPALTIAALVLLAVVTISLPAADAEVKATYYQQDGVVRMTFDEPLPQVYWGGEIINSDGTTYWESILVALGGEEEVFLMESGSRILYEIPDGKYTVNLYPRSGAYDDISAIMTVQNTHDEGSANGMLLVIGAVAAIAIILAAILIVRRSRT